jgi:hypothetical protein
MKTIKTHVPTILLLCALISLVAGGVFAYMGISKAELISSLARGEQVTLGLTEQQIKNGEFVDNLWKMQNAADVIRSHRQAMAQTYGELLAGGKFDPTNPKQLTYAQAINLENYLYLGALSYGVCYMMVGLGAFMVLLAIVMVLLATAIRPLLKAS